MGKSLHRGLCSRSYNDTIKGRSLIWGRIALVKGLKPRKMEEREVPAKMEA